MNSDPFEELLGPGRGSDRADQLPSSLRASVRLAAIVNDQQALRDHVATLDGVAPSGLRTLSLADLLARGYLSRELVGLSVDELSGQRVGSVDGFEAAVAQAQVDVLVTVTDLEAFRSHTLARYEELWKMRIEDPENLRKLIFEALIASNEMPSPDLLGIQLDCNEDDVTLL